MKQAVNSILSVLEREPLEDRVRLADQITVMAETPGWGAYAALLARAVGETRDLVEMGTHEHVEYAAMHGRIRGLRYASSIVEAAVLSGERANDQLRRMAEEGTSHE